MGIFAPTAWNFAGSARNSLISSSSSSASSTPATSAKVTSGFSTFASFALDFPMFMRLEKRPPPPPSCDSRNQKIARMMTNGRRLMSRVEIHDCWGTSSVYPPAGSAVTTASTISSPRCST